MKSSLLLSKLLQKSTLLLGSLVLIGALLRFYNLDWGSPYFFHPDERNIASSISHLRFPTQLNPHFFAYGGLPIYKTFFLGSFQTWISSLNNPQPLIGVSFEQAIMILRFLSATLSTLLIPLSFKLGQRLGNKAIGLLTATFITLSPGLIQYAHFGTFEMWLTFFSLLLFLTTLHALEKSTLASYLVNAAVLGVLISTKVSSIVLLPIALLPLLRRSQPTFVKRLFLLILFGGILGGIWLITNPFSVLDYMAFKGSLTYESAVALGQLKVFYTGEFLGIISGVFPLLHIYPFLLNPVITCLAVPAVLVISILGLKHKNHTYLLLSAFFLITYLSSALLFVQWTRYFVPTLPFVYLLVALFLWEAKKRLGGKLPLVIISGGILLIAVCVLYAFAFFKTVYLVPDSREQAAEFTSSRLSHTARILSETYDLGIIPFNTPFPFITLFNFYELDNWSEEFTPQTLTTALKETDYLILPSQRILKVRLQNSKEFPIGHAFYTELISNKEKYTLVYQTPCDSWCQISLGQDPVFTYEQTATIFDRPTVFIYSVNHDN